MYEKIRFLDSEAVKKWDDLQETKAGLLQKFTRETWENQRLEDYLFDIEKYYNFYDPNAFVIIEERRERGMDNEVKNIQVYPIEATSSQAVNYKIEQGRVKWLVVEFMDKEELANDPGKFKDISKFYMWAAGNAISYIEYHETVPAFNKDVVEIKVGSEVRKFAVSTYETTTVEVPAMRVGAYLDPKTRNETFSPPYWSAMMKLYEAIRDKSMQDVVIPGHVYPKEYALAPKCEYYDEKLGIKCDGGDLGGHSCPRCEGTGSNLHLSEQDKIVLAIPDEGIDLPDLSKLLYWHTPPEWLPTYFDQRIDTIEKAIFWLTFNTQLMEKPVAGVTATEKNMDYDSIQQKLTTYAKVISDNWRKYVRICVQYLESWSEGFVVEHSFPKDHKLQSSQELMSDYKEAKTAGLAYPILERIEDKILSKQRVDDPQEVAMYRAFRAHLPFKDKSESTAARIVSERDRADFDRLLWENSDKAYRIIRDRFTNFPEMSMEVQRSTIDGVLNELAGLIKYQQEPGVNDPNFN